LFPFSLFLRIFTAFLFAGYAKPADEIRTLFYRMMGKVISGICHFYHFPEKITPEKRQVSGYRMKERIRNFCPAVF
jgi:hypothetical protein